MEISLFSLFAPVQLDRVRTLVRAGLESPTKIGSWANTRLVSGNPAALGRFPEGIPIFAFQHDVIGLGCGLDALESIRAYDWQRAAWVRENPGVGKLFESRPVVATCHAVCRRG